MAAAAHRFARAQAWTAAALALVAMLALACKDDGSDGPPPIVGALQFVDEPGTSQTAFAPLFPGGSTGPITVEIVDDEGVLIPDATDEVTITLEANPGVLLLHASGIQAPNLVDNEGRMIELVDVDDPSGPVERYILEKNWRLDAPTSMTWDAANDRYLLVNRAIDNLYDGDPRSGEATLVGDGTAPKVAGMAFEIGGDERLFGVVNKFFPGPNVDSLFEIDPATGELTDLGTLTPIDTTRDILYFSAMAMVPDPLDPSVGTLYAMAIMNGSPSIDHALVEIDPEALTARFIGDTETKVVALAGHPDGTLYGITGANIDVPVPPGPGDLLPEELILIDQDDATPSTAGIILTNGADGEALAFVGGRLYGTLTATAVDGVASFDDLHIDALGDGYTITASASGRAAATSGVFDVEEPTPGGVVDFTTDAITVGEDGGTEVTVTVQIDAPQPHDVYVTAAVGGTASDANDSAPDSDLDYLDYVQFVIPGGQSPPVTTASITFNVLDDDEQETEVSEGVFEDETIVFHIKNAPLAGSLGTNQTLTITIDDSEDVVEEEE